MAIVAFVLSGCSDGADTQPSGSGGEIHVAVSELCSSEPASQCILIGEENVVRPAAFVQADVADAAAVEGLSAIDVTFTKDGAAKFQSLAEEAALAGETSRLVINVGDEVLAAVLVKEPPKGNHIQLSLSPSADARDVATQIQAG